MQNIGHDLNLSGGDSLTSTGHGVAHFLGLFLLFCPTQTLAYAGPEVDDEEVTYPLIVTHSDQTSFPLLLFSFPERCQTTENDHVRECLRVCPIRQILHQAAPSSFSVLTLRRHGCDVLTQKWPDETFQKSLLCVSQNFIQCDLFSFFSDVKAASHLLDAAATSFFFSLSGTRALECARAHTHIPQKRFPAACVRSREGKNRIHDEFSLPTCLLLAHFFPMLP